MFDGSERTFECYVREDTATVIPFLDRETVLLTKQEQPGRSTFWDIPGGRVDPGETIEQAVKRELMEETDYISDDWMEWKRKDNQGMVRFSQGLFVTKNLQKVTHDNHEGGGERIVLVPTKWDELVQSCLKGELRNEMAMLAILGMHLDPVQRARLDAFLK